jgi:N-acetylglucosamine-6-phosphate deacetylase
LKHWSEKWVSVSISPDTTSPTTAGQPGYAGQLPDGRCVRLQVAGTTIDSIDPIPADPDLPHLLPVLVDLQHNGALGHAFTEMWRCGDEGLREVATLLRRHGVGRCLPTLITASADGLARSVAHFDAALQADSDMALLYRGLFHEGVYISPQDGWRGVHDRRLVRPPDADALATLDTLSGHRIRIVNVAPEEPGGLDFIRQAVDAGKIVSIGHCNPDAATVHHAADAGASMVTHFGNGAASPLPRFDNPFWAMLNEPRLRLGMIGDGFHLPPDLAGTAMRVRDADGCFFVSDAASLSGCPAGRYEDTYAEPCVIEPDGRLHVADSPMLAAAWFQLDRSVEWLVQTQGLTLHEAWRLCSDVPARILGEPLPPFEVGGEASFVLARWEDGLIIEQSVHAGQAYLDTPIRPTDCGTSDGRTSMQNDEQSNSVD